MKNKFTELTRSMMAAVVQIHADGYFGEDIQSILNPRLGDLKSWTGSGFFINTEFGEDIIVTNAHVVMNAKSIRVTSMLTSEESFAVQTIGIVKDQEPDVAILRLKEGELKRFKLLAKSIIPHLDLRKGSDISRGTELKAVGYPIGMKEPNITGGEITNFMSGSGTVAEKYVTDAAINPGNSGGPAIDNSGKVIGINTSMLSKSENIGFITPFKFIKIILHNIFKENSICFSDISGRFQKNSEAISHSLGMLKNEGLIVNYVERGGFLDKIGVREGDVILSLNGRAIDRHGIFLQQKYYNRRNLFDTFKLIPIGNKVTITLWRDGREIHKSGKTIPGVKKKIVSNPIINEREFVEIWGMTVQVLSFEIFEGFKIIDDFVFYQLIQNYDEYKERLIVTHIKKESPAYLQNWTKGETMERINNTPVESMEHLIKLLENRAQTFKFESSSGLLGFFSGDQLQQKVELKNPSHYLR